MSATGLYVHRFVPARNASTATLLLLHGMGGDESDLIPLGRTLAPDAALLSPRGKVLENGLTRFFRRFPGNVFDVDDLKFRAQELAEFVQGASASYQFDPGNVIALGFSNGANMAAAISLLQPDLLRAAILFCSLVPLVPERKPELVGKSFFVGAGRTDPIVPSQETERLVALLQGAGAEVTVQWQPGGHLISDRQVQAVKNWLSLILSDEREYVER